ncbi:MAG: TetR/AcrR family transcriptional regulator [Spirochaetales bacterium]|nr:TetR/AcrR family transcriptional regulator [Spirochaetales bacterium]
MARNNKKDLILKTAINILTRQNYQNMTTSSIAKKANISEGTIYTYFKNKRELFIEVLRVISVRLSEAVAVGISPEKNLKENLRKLGENFFQMPAESTNLYKIIYKAFSEVEDRKIKAELEQVYTRGLQRIREVIQVSLKKGRQDLPEEKLGVVLTMLWGIGDMVWKRSMISGKHELKENEIRDIIDIITQYLNV